MKVDLIARLKTRGKGRRIGVRKSRADIVMRSRQGWVIETSRCDGLFGTHGARSRGGSDLLLSAGDDTADHAGGANLISSGNGCRESSIAIGRVTQNPVSARRLRTDRPRHILLGDRSAPDIGLKGSLLALIELIVSGLNKGLNCGRTVVNRDIGMLG